jgi:ribosomal protein S6
VKEADRKKLLETVKEWMKPVKVAKEEDWGQKPLAYTIKKEEAGLYYLLQLESEAGVPADLEQRILRDDSIIRHLLVRTK